MSTRLLLLGTLLFILGFRLATAAAGALRGNRTAWARALVAAILLLAVNVPLAPIQGFAIALCVFDGVSLLALLAIRRHTT